MVQVLLWAADSFSFGYEILRLLDPEDLSPIKTDLDKNLRT
jgi:hypothetical protein